MAEMCVAAGRPYSEGANHKENVLGLAWRVLQRAQRHSNLMRQARARGRTWSRPCGASGLEKTTSISVTLCVAAGGSLASRVGETLPLTAGERVETNHS